MVQQHLIVFGYFSVNALCQLVRGEFSNFCWFHKLSVFVVIVSYNKFGRNRKFLSGQAESFFSYFIRYTFNLENDAARSNREYISYGISLTFTHTYISRFLGNGFVREYTDPDLSFTLHITVYSHTGCLNLTSGQPMCIEAFNTKATECKLVTALCVTLATAFLRASVFCSFRL